MKVTTRDFGEIEIAQENIICFKQPIFGFEACQRYVMLQDEGMGAHFAWLQSLDEIEVCFILVMPKVVVRDYAPALPEAVRPLLGEGKLQYWLIMSVHNQFKDSTVNLKSPVVINPAQKCAAQVILEDDYPIRYPLLPQEEGDD